MHFGVLLNPVFDSDVSVLGAQSGGYLEAEGPGVWERSLAKPRASPFFLP